MDVGCMCVFWGQEFAVQELSVAKNPGASTYVENNEHSITCKIRNWKRVFVLLCAHFGVTVPSLSEAWGWPLLSPAKQGPRACRN